VHTPSKPLPIQQAILTFIEEYPYKFSPTLREIADGVGLASSGSVQVHLDLLETMGYIRRVANSPQAWQIIKTHTEN
jgi:repressor LexA